MLQAALWGAAAGSAVLIGAAIGLYVRMSRLVLGFIMAYGTGVLIGAASFELLNEAVSEGGLWITARYFISGAVIFTAANAIIAKKGGGERKKSKRNRPSGQSGLAILIGTVMDAIPESLIIGVSLLEGSQVSLLMVLAIFISNFPEGMSSSTGFLQDGYSRGKILGLWIVVFLLSALSSWGGYVLLRDASDVVISAISAFAAGGMIAMTSSTMMPEAYEEGGPTVGLVTAAGLLSALLLTAME